MFPSEQAAGVSCTSFCSLGNLIPDLELSAPQRGHGHLTNTHNAEEDVSRDIKFVSVKGLSVGLIKMQLLPVCPS